jgi:gamma-glutamyltranspeptidase/glutathione hydrolase
VLAPAVRLAEEGFPVAPVTAYFWSRGAERQLRHAFGGLELTIDGRAPRPGEVFHNPGLGRTFRRVAEGGQDAYYQGEIAAAIASVVQKAGGCMSEVDLAAHASTGNLSRSIPRRPAWECLPNGQADRPAGPQPAGGLDPAALPQWDLSACI